MTFAILTFENSGALKTLKTESRMLTEVGLVCVWGIETLRSIVLVPISMVLSCVI